MKPREAVERREDRRAGFKMLGPGEREGLELLTEEFDFYLRRGREGWTVDVFRAEVPDHERAHVASEGFETLGAALRYIGGFTEERRDPSGPGPRDFLTWGW